jgi:AraC-like DNA-binding protein
MLTVLQKQILPDLQSNGARRLVMAHLPLHVPDGISVRELSSLPLLEEDAQKIYPGGKQWTSSGMHAIQYPSLYCVVEGAADLSMGVTSSMIRNAAVKSTFKDQPGGYIFSLSAPAYLLVPPNVPQKTLPPWSRETPHTGKMVVFVMRILPMGALCTMSEMQDDIYTVQYSLLVKDDQLASVIGILISELKEAAVDWGIVKAQISTLMLRLRRGLNREMPFMTDGMYSRFPDDDSSEAPLPLLHHPIIERIHRYIQLHLHEPLTPLDIARHANLSPDHLNRVLKAHAGLTTMNYVARLRMEAAALLLQTSDLSVQEISHLVGYQQLPHFSRSFYRHIGETPLKYRQKRGDVQRT